MDTKEFTGIYQEEGDLEHSSTFAVAAVSYVFALLAFPDQPDRRQAPVATQNGTLICIESLTWTRRLRHSSGPCVK